MKLAIFGSRTLCDERIAEIIQQNINELSPTEIITSGKSRGTMNELRIAKKMNVPLDYKEVQINESEDLVWDSAGSLWD